MKNAAIFWYDELDSTNAEVLRRISDIDNLSVVAARTQTRGRGQRGNRWLAAPGENLTFTACLKFPKDYRPLIWINEMAALSVREYLRSRNIPALIKWPNDIYVRSRKICGILVENLLSAEMVQSAVGIGINLNQTRFPSELLNPTSMKCLSGIRYDPQVELEAFMEVFCRQYEREFDALHAEFGSELFQQGIPARYRDLQSGEVFTGTILGVEKDGRLRVERDGTVRIRGFKDIGYIL